MKKTFLALAVAAVAAVCFTACPGPQEKTTADYLSAPKNGWVLESALCSPAYEMLSGELIGDLVNGYLYDFEKDDIIAFGDSFNDIDMLEYAGFGVAMGNAPDPVKASADAVTDDNDHDGLAKAINKYME